MVTRRPGCGPCPGRPLSVRERCSESRGTAARNSATPARAGLPVPDAARHSRASAAQLAGRRVPRRQRRAPSVWHRHAGDWPAPPARSASSRPGCPAQHSVARYAWRAMWTAKYQAAALPPSSDSTTAAVSPATTGLRRHQRQQPLAAGPPAGPGSARPSSQRRRSSASSPAVCVAPAGLLGHRLQADRLQVARDAVVEAARRPRLVVQHLVQQHPRGAAERQLAGQQLVEDHAQAVDVAAAIDLVAPRRGPAPGLM